MYACLVHDNLLYTGHTPANAPYWTPFRLHGRLKHRVLFRTFDATYHCTELQPVSSSSE